MRTTNTDGAKEETKQPELTPALLEQLRATDAAQLIRQAEDFARLVDFVPDVAANTNNQFASLSVMNNEGTLSERYEYILRMSQVMKSELPDATKQKIEKFRNLLQITKNQKRILSMTAKHKSRNQVLWSRYTTQRCQHISMPHWNTTCIALMPCRPITRKPCNIGP